MVGRGWGPIGCSHLQQCAIEAKGNPQHYPVRVQPRCLRVRQGEEGLPLPGFATGCWVVEATTGTHLFNQVLRGSKGVRAVAKVVLHEHVVPGVSKSIVVNRLRPPKQCTRGVQASFIVLGKRRRCSHKSNHISALLANLAGATTGSKTNKAKHNVSLCVQRLTLGDGTLAVDRPSTAPAGSVTDACTWNLT